MSDYDWVQWTERASASLKQSRGITADEDSRMYNYLRGWLAGQAGDASGLSDMAGRITIKEQSRKGWWPR